MDETKQYPIGGRRKPTEYEIYFGEGGTHYKFMPRHLWVKKDGTLKKWTVCPVDGLRYYR